MLYHRAIGLVTLYIIQSLVFHTVVGPCLWHWETYKSVATMHRKPHHTKNARQYCTQPNFCTNTDLGSQSYSISMRGGTSTAIISSIITTVCLY